ncbi:hypothetical protein GGR07_000251 [Bacteroides pyogenes]|nr:hypothetical protein [Bacteroides pyogenes]SUV34096.1 Uncharacterised protein [Bacteroides pyogenes]
MDLFREAEELSAELIYTKTVLRWICFPASVMRESIGEDKAVLLLYLSFKLLFRFIHIRFMAFCYCEMFIYGLRAFNYNLITSSSNWSLFPAALLRILLR